MWLMILSRRELRAPGASFWSNAKWMTHLKMVTTAQSLFVSEMTWSILKCRHDWTLSAWISFPMSLIISSSWCRCCSWSLTMLAIRSVFCFWALLAVLSLKMCTELYMDNVRAVVAATNEAMSNCRHWHTGTWGRLARRSWKSLKTCLMSDLYSSNMLFSVARLYWSSLKLKRLRSGMQRSICLIILSWRWSGAEQSNGILTWLVKVEAA